MKQQVRNESIVKGNGNFRLMKDGYTVQNLETRETYVDVFDDGYEIVTDKNGNAVEDEDGVIVNVRREFLASEDGIDYVTPQGSKDMNNLQRLFGDDMNLDNGMHIIDVDEEQKDDILSFVNEDGQEVTWNFSAIQRQTIRKKMLRELAGYKMTTRQAISLMQTVNDKDAVELLKLYQHHPNEMTLMDLFNCLDSRGKFYEVYK